MTRPALDLGALLSPDVRAVLEKHGLVARVVVTDSAGVSPSDAEIVKLQAELVKASQRLGHLHQLATIGEVSAGVLHEARNLLTGVVGLSLVRSNDESHLDLLRSEANRCSKLLTTFLNSASRAPGYPANIQPREVMNAVVTLLGAEAKSRRCNLSAELPDDLPSIVTFAQELQQVLLNLTLNALEASPEGGSVVLSASYTDQELSLCVADEGHGVPEPMLERIFEPFVSSKPPSRGTGLGLSTSRRLVETMHGRLTVENRAPCGAVFTVVLPRHNRLRESMLPGATP
jgi:signal transduction histidine kinase